MNRRTFLKGRLLPESTNPISTFTIETVSLSPYSGEWTDEQRKHLLRRTLIGFSPEHFNQVKNLSLEQILENLLSKQALPPKPLAYLNTGSVTAGSEWTSATYDANQENVRIAFLLSWQIESLLHQPIRIHDKMVLFWQNHFATGANAVKDARLMHKQFELLFENATGNVKDLVYSIVFDPSMLRYLNGNSNTKIQPNENFARELQELFTIGKGPEISPGNYTNYTEEDINQAARILTGWYDDQSTMQTKFRSNNHDFGIKKFSSAYGNRTISSSATNELGARQEVQDLMHMIFDQEATSLFIIKKLYRYFVDYVIDAEIESNIIKPLAKLFRDSSFDIIPVLRVLFSSEHFYSTSLLGCAIKTPIELVLGTCTLFKPALIFPSDSKEIHWAYRTLRRIMAQMGQDIMNPPNVAGLPAYYQEPAYHELWINADTLQKRIKFIGDLSLDHLQLDEMAYGKGALIDVFSILEWADDPSDPVQVIEAWCHHMFALKISPETQYTLKKFLTGGLEDFVWTNEWLDWNDNPTDTKKAALESKLRTLLKHMLSMAEYQLN